MSERPTPRGTASRRVGSAVSDGAARIARAPWTLRLAPFLLLIPAMIDLAAGWFVDFAALALGFTAMQAAGICVQRGQAATEAFDERQIAKAPPPWRLLAAILTTVGVLIVGLGATSIGLLQSVAYALLAGLGCVLAYGLDPARSKRLAADKAAKAGLDDEKVIQVIDEASAKLSAIEKAAKSLRAADHRARVARITAAGRAVLDELERDPADIPRARRFLATYLDSTREVIEKFVRQQDEPGGEQLERGFASVLATVERVFGEQVDHLKRDEQLDLEVQIEVLESQMDREGVR